MKLNFPLRIITMAMSNGEIIVRKNRSGERNKKSIGEKAKESRGSLLEVKRPNRSFYSPLLIDIHFDCLILSFFSQPPPYLNPYFHRNVFFLISSIPFFDMTSKLVIVHQAPSGDFQIFPYAFSSILLLVRRSSLGRWRWRRLSRVFPVPLQPYRYHISYVIRRNFILFSARAYDQ